ncbi:hypothetical protein JTE90_016424 [Oedothorax gibbosus]|uniref:Uncharacterized protein n=1 Tax=Oedothorax gibbosus TaxID=931172 RepID=A0AAV6TCS9_9ARAC|nr:hypothetical protein JTE90_016424 [Oedothorax gibbosus]
MIEAFTLETAADMVRPGTKITLSPRFFKGQRAPRKTARTRCFTRTAPFPGRAFPGGKELLKRKIIFPGGPPSTSPIWVALPHLVPKDLSPCPGVGGILTPTPFSVGSGDKPRAVFAFRRGRLASERFSPTPWDRLPHFQLLFKGTLSSFSPQG